MQKVSIMYQDMTSQTGKRGAMLENLGEKSCEIKGRGQEMATDILKIISFDYLKAPVL